MKSFGFGLLIAFLASAVWIGYFSQINKTERELKGLQRQIDEQRFVHNTERKLWERHIALLAECTKPDRIYWEKKEALSESWRTFWETNLTSDVDYPTLQRLLNP